MMMSLRQPSAIQARRSTNQTPHHRMAKRRRQGVPRGIGIVLKLLMMLAVVAGFIGERQANAVGTTTLIVLAGETVPDGNGTFLNFGFDTPPVLNDAGQVAFAAEIFNPSTGLGDGTGLFLGDGSTLTQVVRTGQAAPDGNGSISTIEDFAINGAGQVAFLASVSDTDTLRGIGLFRGDGSTLTQIARTGQAAPDGNGSIRIFFIRSADGLFSFNDAGQVAFRPDILVDGAFSDNSAIFRGDGAALTPIVHTGQAAPDGNGSLGGIFRQHSLNEAGQAAFVSFLTDTNSPSNTDGIFRSDGSTLTQIVRGGQVLPDGSGTFDGFSNPSTFDSTPAINDAGQVAFFADVGSFTPGDAGFFLGDGLTTTQIVRTGETEPDGDDQFTGTFFRFALNNAGRVAFTARLEGSHGPPSDGIFLGDGETLTQIARAGQVTPDGIGSFGRFFGKPAINDAGQVAFSSGPDHVDGLFFYDDILGLLQIARLGDAFLGSTISRLDTIAGSPSGEEFTGLNNLGQVAFSFRLDDGRRGIAIWTVPEPGSASLALLGLGGTLLRRRRR